MLTALSIRDIVLIDKLDLDLDQAMSVLTGETGAGKSILLDALGLALGGRGDSSLVRTGAERGVVTAAFSVSADHAGVDLLCQQGFDVEDGEIIVRRVQNADGPSRAFINDQPAGIALLKKLGTLLAEIHGQHDDRAMVDPVQHRRLVDAYGGLAEQGAKLARLWHELVASRAAFDEHAEKIVRSEKERAFIEHAVGELRELSPQAGEEEQLAGHRQLMMNAEHYANAINDALTALNGDKELEANLNVALRKLERRRDTSIGRLDAACEALERLVVEMAEAQSSLVAAGQSFAFDPQELDRTEERLFALKALARKHNVTVDELVVLQAQYEADLTQIEDSAGTSKKLLELMQQAEQNYFEVADALSEARRKAAVLLDQAVVAELGPLRLEQARFETVINSDAERPGIHGIDRVEFVIAANPGTPLAPLGKVASGGELSRFMLALKVVLAACGSAPTLIFDEIDTGVGGAVADAIGQRLARLADRLQVITVTHSPQVASRANAHMLITKMSEVGSENARTVTRVMPLSGESRREEIARMLSGAAVTTEARAQADRLIAGAG